MKQRSKKIPYKDMVKCRNLNDFIPSDSNITCQRKVTPFSVKSFKRQLFKEFPEIVEYCKKHQISFSEAIKRLKK
jgi:hypothetical protein